MMGIRQIPIQFLAPVGLWPPEALLILHALGICVHGCCTFIAPPFPPWSLHLQSPEETQRLITFISPALCTPSLPPIQWTGIGVSMLPLLSPSRDIVPSPPFDSPALLKCVQSITSAFLNSWSASYTMGHSTLFEDFEPHRLLYPFP